MKRLFGVGLLLAALAIPALTASLEFRLTPQGQATDRLPIKSVFYVVLVGAEGDVQPTLFIWDLQRNWSSAVVGPKKIGDLLVWGPIQLKRSCDEVREGVAEAINAGIGDMLVAAVDLQGGTKAPERPESMPPGPSATARVTPPARGERKLSILKGEESVQELAEGTYRVVLEAPDLDRYCRVEELPLSLIGPGGEKAKITLRETGSATGTFVADLAVSYAVEGCSLKAEVGPLTLEPGGEVTLKAASRSLALEVAALDVSLKATLADGKEAGILDVGQPFSVSISPAGYDEVRWCLDGKEVEGDRFVLEEPGKHTLTAFVHKGTVWGRASIELRAVPGTEIKPVGRESSSIPALGVPMVEAGAGEKLCFRLENAEDDAAPVVYVGKLGKGCPKNLKVGPDHRFYLDLKDLGAQPGDILWIYYEDPDFAADHALVLVRVK